MYTPTHEPGARMSVFSVLASLADSPSSSSASLAGELVQAISAPTSTVMLEAATNAYRPSDNSIR